MNPAHGSAFDARRVRGKFAWLTSRQIAEVDSDSTVVVQPLGAVEQHGAHLPLITDAWIAECLAGLAADRALHASSIWLLPTLCYGRSVEHLDLPGTVALSTSVLLDVLGDVGRSLHRSRVRRLVFVNGHGGQPGLLETAARDIRAETAMQVFSINTGRLGMPDGMSNPDPFDIHAGFTETSMMLALAPESVRTGLAVAETAPLTRTFSHASELSLEGDFPTAWLVPDITASGVVGDPTGATREAGEAIVEYQANRLARALDDIATFTFSHIKPLTPPHEPGVT